MIVDKSVGYSEAQVARAGAELVASIDPKRYVGHKHHVVPAFILKRFANAKNQLQVRDLARNTTRMVNVNDLAVTDFYTFINTSGELDSSYEHLWGQIEAGASRALRDHLRVSAFVKPRPFSDEEKVAIDALVALQSPQGPGPAKGERAHHRLPHQTDQRSSTQCGRHGGPRVRPSPERSPNSDGPALGACSDTISSHGRPVWSPLIGPAW